MQASGNKNGRILLLSVRVHLYTQSLVFHQHQRLIRNNMNFRSSRFARTIIGDTEGGGLDFFTQFQSHLYLRGCSPLLY